MEIKLIIVKNKFADFNKLIYNIEFKNINLILINRILRAKLINSSFFYKNTIEKIIYNYYNSLSIIGRYY